MRRPSARCGPLPGGAAAREALLGQQRRRRRRGQDQKVQRPRSCAAAGHLAGAGCSLWGSSHREAEAATETLPGDGHSQQCALQRALGLLRGGRTEGRWGGSQDQVTSGPPSGSLTPQTLPEPRQTCSAHSLRSASGGCRGIGRTDLGARRGGAAAAAARPGPLLSAPGPLGAPGTAAAPPRGRQGSPAVPHPHAQRALDNALAAWATR